MAGTIPLADFVTLGQQLYVLMNPQNADVVIAEIPGFLASLEKCGLHRSRTAADVLTRIESIPLVRGSRLIGQVARLEFKAYLEPIFRTIYAEIGEQVAVAINVGVVSQQLRQLPTVLALTPTQTDLLNETITCIECGAYRAGIVLAWNMAYDYIRQWILDNHLPAFNGKLTTMYLRKDGKPIYDPINSYDDFCTGKPGERTVIDTCAMAHHFRTVAGQ